MNREVHLREPPRLARALDAVDRSSFFGAF
jgi:hypothetical protein